MSVQEARHEPWRLGVADLAAAYRSGSLDPETLLAALLDRIARLLKDDRDKNFVAKAANGTTVNRWVSTGMLAASASTNETGYLTYKWARGMGMLMLDNQARV